MKDHVTLAGKQFTVSSLNLRGIRKLAVAGHLEKISKPAALLVDAEQLDAMIAVVAVSIQREHPEIDEDWLLDNVEPTEILPAFQVILKIAGFRKEDKSPNVESRS